ncbi:hypothetical protein IB234_20620 [Pseudomonas sp. PDM16]|uniref:hypothetical protein n=1 Tax=Pseudomonas sp. PDM16 TaxID=2769292 RepID=UPI00178299C9|nr:hypothetical protein [Pseudomonas sp. PDM16]MBD9416976.1 hypothetical protein [Pseudomonas sp. PDM16]
MNSRSRVMTLTVVLVLVMVAVITLTAALYLSSLELDAMRQQSRAWEIYSLSLYERSLIEIPLDVAGRGEPSNVLVGRWL